MGNNFVSHQSNDSVTDQHWVKPVKDEDGS